MTSKWLKSVTLWWLVFADVHSVWIHHSSAGASVLKTSKDFKGEHWILWIQHNLDDNNIDKQHGCDYCQWKYNELSKREFYQMVAFSSHRLPCKNTACLHPTCGVIIGICKMWRSNLPWSKIDIFSGFSSIFVFELIILQHFNYYFYTMVYLFIFYSNTIALKKQHFTPLCILLIFRIACKGTCNFFRIGVHNPDKRPFGRILSICETLKCLCGSQRCHQSQRWGHVEWLNLERGETMQRRVGMLSANDHGAC